MQPSQHLQNIVDRYHSRPGPFSSTDLRNFHTSQVDDYLTVVNYDDNTDPYETRTYIQLSWNNNDKIVSMKLDERIDGAKLFVRLRLSNGSMEIYYEIEAADMQVPGYLTSTDLHLTRDDVEWLNDAPLKWLTYTANSLYFYIFKLAWRSLESVGIMFG